MAPIHVLAEVNQGYEITTESDSLNQVRAKPVMKLNLPARLIRAFLSTCVIFDA